MKRLRRNAKFFDSIMAFGETVEIFINPSSKEISEAKKASGENSVRGVILDDGTEYCWDGLILHDRVNVVDTQSFHFAYENGYGWFCDAVRKYTKKEFLNLVLKYESKLSKYGNTSEQWEIGNFRDANKGLILYGVEAIKEELNKMENEKPPVLELQSLN